ncbi:MAG: hypothetical protein FJW40_00845 [Acidobacteria bacterium]|nr:hypothetical protein [Acidobacteriota bacterium]
MRSLLWLIATPLLAAVIPADTTGVRPGRVTVRASGELLTVEWRDARSRVRSADFNLDTAKPVIAALKLEGVALAERINPVFNIETGKRRGGWDEFFDYPPSHPEGTRRFLPQFRPTRAQATGNGARAEVCLDGLTAGPFVGRWCYTFFDGSSLIQQEAVLTTSEPDTAYFYDAGIRMAGDADRRPGNNMESRISYFDTSGSFQTIPTDGPDRRPVAARFRMISAAMGRGSVVVFPLPHQYFMPRDFTTNLAHVWHSGWRGQIGLGIRQLNDEDWRFYPWMNAPPGTEQRMSLFLIADDRPPRAAMDDALRYTHGDRYVHVPGYRTLAAHWHLAYTVQALAQKPGWVPPWKTVLKSMGVDAAMIMDFHGDGHPQDRGETRLKELEAYYRYTRALSDPEFLVIPAEEANVHLGGHWAVVFPKPVQWIMSRRPNEPFVTQDPVFGKVYRTGNPKEMLDLVRAEGGFMYQTHPRTKGSKGFPDKIMDTEPFRDPRYWGAGWKQMPADLSSPRLGDRSLKLLDDLNHRDLPKRLLAETDLFQFDATHEVYAHMNVNYVRIGEVPGFDSYGTMLDAIDRGNYFMSTGEVLLPRTVIGGDQGAITVRAVVENTFPLRMAEVVWGDGTEVRRQVFDLSDTPEFRRSNYEWTVQAPGWRWARVAVWDVAGNGAFVNPTRRAGLSARADFEGGSIGRVEAQGERGLRLALAGDKDQDGRNRQANWYYFRVDGQGAQPVTLDLVDLPGEYNYKPNRGAVTADTPPVISYDNQTWSHVETFEYDAAEPRMRLTIQPRQFPFWIAHVPPYTGEHLARLRQRAQGRRGFREEVIGKSVQGRPLYLWTIGSGAKTAWLMFRQHGWETGSSWAGEGLVRKLLEGGGGDVTWKIVPMPDPDGVARGNVRFNVHGFDLNRNWDTPDPVKMPENHAVMKAMEGWRAGGGTVDLFLTLHNTETSEYLEGPPGGAHHELAAGFFDRMEKFSTFNPSRPLFHSEVTTTPGKPGRMTVAQGLFAWWGIPAFTMEQRISMNSRLGRRPLVEDRVRFGEQLAAAIGQLLGKT